MFFASARNMRQYKEAIDILDLTPVFDSEEDIRMDFMIQRLMRYHRMGNVGNSIY